MEVLGMLFGMLGAGGGLRAQQSQPPDLTGTWVLDIAKSARPGRTLKFDTTTFVRTGGAYQVIRHFDAGAGEGTDTLTWPVASGVGRYASADGSNSAVTVRQTGDTVSYVREYGADGAGVQSMSGRTWLSSDGRTRLENFEVASTDGEPDIARYVYDKTDTRSDIRGKAGARHAGPTYEVYMVRFAGFHAFPVAELVRGADTARRTDLAFMVGVMKGAGHNVLLDAGFYREKFLTAWKPFDWQRPSIAIAKVGLTPEDITDIIISHVHWDHLDGADLFPKARIWIQKAEYDHYVGSNGEPRDNAIDTADAQMLAQLHHAGRVRLVDGDAREVIPGITVYTGGRHTYASEYVGVQTAGGVVVLASDNMYMFENLAKHAPIGATYAPADSTSNLHAQDRMGHIASSPRFIIPGHDPQVFVRFPAPGDGVAKIE
jgi:glyoxylase-like metal-dependent hydrolase (beta-lactamase superfamily II)